MRKHIKVGGGADVVLLHRTLDYWAFMNASRSALVVVLMNRLAVPAPARPPGPMGTTSTSAAFGGGGAKMTDAPFGGGPSAFSVAARTSSGLSGSCLACGPHGCVPRTPHARGPIAPGGGRPPTGCPRAISPDTPAVTSGLDTRTSPLVAHPAKAISTTADAKNEIFITVTPFRRANFSIPPEWKALTVVYTNKASLSSTQAANKKGRRNKGFPLSAAVIISLCRY